MNRSFWMDLARALAKRARLNAEIQRGVFRGAGLGEVGYELDLYTNKDGGCFAFLMARRDEDLAAFRKGCEDHLLLMLQDHFGLRLQVLWGCQREASATESKGAALPLWLSDGSNTAEFWCCENGVQFRLEGGDVLNPGVFLDQSFNRKNLVEWISSQTGIPLSTKSDGGGSTERVRGSGVDTGADAGAMDQNKILNLFSYTGAFSVAAARCGVKAISVDASKRYLNWEAANHEKNGTALHSVRWWGDAREKVKQLLKKQERFLAVVVDPPTFARASKASKAFRIQQDIWPLLDDVARLVVPGGRIYFSTNDFRWYRRDLERNLTEWCDRKGFSLEKGEVPRDVSCGAVGEESLLKSFRLINWGN